MPLPHRLRPRRLTLIAGLSLIAAAGPAWADEGLTTRSGVLPLTDDGRLTACQAPFEAVRADPEYSGGRRVRLEGRLLVVGPGQGQPGVVVELRTHAPDDPADAEGAAPARVVLRDGDQDNAAERYTGNGAEAAGGGSFIFTLGPVTRAAVRSAAGDGRFTLAYAQTADGPLAPLTIDLTVKRRTMGRGVDQDPASPQALTDCLRRLRLDAILH